MPQFTITQDAQAAKPFIFPDAPIITIGRSQTNDLTLPDSSLKVSRFHAAVVRVPGPTPAYFVRDLSSLHGTRIDGALICQQVLREGDVLEISDYRLAYSGHIHVKQSSGRFLPRAGGGSLPEPLAIAGAATKSALRKQSALSPEKHEALAELVQRYARILDPTLLFPGLLCDIGKLMGADRGFIGIFRDKKTSAHDEAAVMGMSSRDQISISGGEAALLEVRNNRSVSDGATLLVPLLIQGEGEGFICIDGSRIRAPFSCDELAFLVSVGRFAARMERKPASQVSSSETAKPLKWPPIVTKSPAMAGLLRGIEEASADDRSVLIHGESGTGKELAAHALHEQSSRSGGPFVARNCAELVENLAKTEIFGYAPRSGISGADPQGAPGWFELADRGSLLLDEIQSLSLAMQDQFLRVLESKEVQRSHARKPVSVDVKVIAATTQDLEEAIDRGKFREALYHRLPRPLFIPPLRDRKDDIVLLAHAFLDNHAAEKGTRTRSLSRKALQQLHDYDWPGNVRELKNVVLNAASMERAIILSWELDSRITRKRSDGQDDRTQRSRSLSIVDTEIEMIKEGLETTKGNIAQAQRLLGYKSYQTMLNKMKKYGIPHGYGDPSRS